VCRKERGGWDGDGGGGGRAWEGGGGGGGRGGEGGREEGEGGEMSNRAYREVESSFLGVGIVWFSARGRSVSIRGETNIKPPIRQSRPGTRGCRGGHTGSYTKVGFVGFSDVLGPSGALNFWAAEKALSASITLTVRDGASSGFF